MKKSIFLFALLLLSYSLSYSQDTLWTRRYDIPGFIKNAVFLPDDSKILVTGTETFFEVNPQNGEMIREMPELAGRGVRYVEPDKNIGINYSCQLVDLNDYKVIKQIVDTNKYKVPPMFNFVYTDDLRRVAFTYLKNIIVIDVMSGTEIILEQEFPAYEEVGYMDLSPDGRYLGLWSAYYEHIDDEHPEYDVHYQMIKILDIKTNTVLKKFSFPSDQQSRTLKFSPDGSMLAVHTRAGIDMYTVPDLEFVNNFQFVPLNRSINDYTFTKNSDNLMIIRTTQIQTFNIHENKLIAENLSSYILGQFIRFANTTDNVLISNHANHDEAIYLLNSKITSIGVQDKVSQVYPNPATGVLILKLPIFQIGNFKILILNNEGRTVFTQDYISTNDNISIDVSGYSRGVYFISVENSNRILQTYKFIKE